MVLSWTVVKQSPIENAPVTAFEYGVILNGSKTYIRWPCHTHRFEYGVILNGSKTAILRDMEHDAFEYGVILNGSKTSV